MNIPVLVNPPQNWQDFEDMTLDLAKKMWDSDNFDKYGRGGQAQHGVDIFGRDKDGSTIGIQCKHKKQYGADGSVSKCTTGITQKDVEDEYNAATLFKPKLQRFIIVTSSLRDTKIQDVANNLNGKRKKIVVEIWFWERIQSELNKNPDLLYWYYENFLKENGLYNKDIYILSSIKNSFMRPAFSTEFFYENSCEDFLLAIMDTQKVINTGVLKDRNGKALGSFYAAEHISNPVWKEKIKTVSNILQNIRNLCTYGMKKGLITQSKNSCFINISDEHISQTLNYLRAEAIKTLNTVLAEMECDAIESPLLNIQWCNYWDEIMNF